MPVFISSLIVPDRLNIYTRMHMLQLVYIYSIVDVCYILYMNIQPLSKFHSFLPIEIYKVRCNLFHLQSNKEPMVLPDADGEIIQLTEKLFVPQREHPDVSYTTFFLGLSSNRYCNLHKRFGRIEQNVIFLEFARDKACLILLTGSFFRAVAFFFSYIEPTFLLFKFSNVISFSSINERYWHNIGHRINLCF